MTYDAVELNRDLRAQRQKQSFNWFQWLTFALLVAFSLYMYLWEFANTDSDLYKHAVIASQFVFTDLHSITSRLAYPLWHLFVAALNQLGVPLNWAAALMCTVCKAIAFLLVCRYLRVMTHGRTARAWVTLCALLLMLVTPIRVTFINDWVYRGVGSPTVWHNPTQLAVLATALVCVPYLLHCWYAFEREAPQQGAQTMLPWRKVVTLSVLLMLNLASKPTFMQALIPAAALFFLVQWIRYPKNSRYFMQIILAFLPAVAYFLLQYLYYTGVVVPFTSGVEFGITWEGVWIALRNMLLMTAFPLVALLVIRRSRPCRDQAVVLSLMMVVFSVLEAMSFHETGVRINHGNFNWASMSSAFMLWVTVLPQFINSIATFRADRALLQASVAEGAMDTATVKRARFGLRLRSAGYFVSILLLVWHAYSSIYYLYFLMASGNVF